MHKIVTLLTIMFALAAVDAQASLIANGSFENTNNTFVGDANKVDELNSGSTAIPGWMTTNGVQTAWIENGNPYGISAIDGQFFLDLTGYFRCRHIRWRLRRASPLLPVRTTLPLLIWVMAATPLEDMGCVRREGSRGIILFEH